MLQKYAILPVAAILLSGCAAFSPDMPSNGDADMPPLEGIEFEEVASGLDIPWAIAFLPDGRMVFTERPGRVKVLDSGAVHEVRGVVHLGEGGLQGIAVDPDFQSNNFIYLYYTYSEGAALYNRVSRFTFSGTALSGEAPLLERIPGNVYHDGGRMKFGPDGMLYITTGDAGDQGSAQDLGSLAGKILRINPDGSIPADNPFNSAVFSYGHRNPQGLDWHPDSGLLVATEHGPGKNDEVNVISEGSNYGWPEKLCSQGAAVQGFTEAAVCFPDWTLAPSGAAFYGGDGLPFRGAFIYGGLRGEQIRIALFSGDSLESDGLLADGFGRIREVVEGPDGYIYFATNNTDGRGTPREGDDRIYRIAPKTK